MYLPRSLTTLALALCASVLTACDATGPTGPEVDPEPQLETVYDLTVTTRLIKVRGSCDTNAFGTASAGEFQYKVDVYGEGQTNTHGSSGYNSITGKVYQKAPGGEIDFTNKTYRWSNLEKTTGVRVKLYGAEWDGITKDDRMKNRSGSKVVPFKVGKDTHEVVIGATAACQIRLVYNATWTEGFVEVG